MDSSDTKGKDEGSDGWTGRLDKRAGGVEGGSTLVLSINYNRSMIHYHDDPHSQAKVVETIVVKPSKWPTT